MCQQCSNEIGQFLKGGLPISGVCLCPPDFVMMFKVASEDRWVVGSRICPPMDVVTEAIDNAFEYLAGNYREWVMMCVHCGHQYAGDTIVSSETRADH